MRDLGKEARSPALGVWSLSHWTTQEVPWWEFLRFTLSLTFKYTIQRVYYSPHAVHHTPRTYLSYSWKFVPFDHLPPIRSPSPTASGNHKSDRFCDCYLFISRFHTHVRSYRICFSLSISFNIVPSRCPLSLSQMAGFPSFFGHYLPQDIFWGHVSFTALQLLWISSDR